MRLPALEVESVATPRRWSLLGLAEDVVKQGPEYASTFITQFADLACQILAYKLAARFLGKQGFSEYAVARRAISTIYPVTLLGLGVALPRYIALSMRDHQAAMRDRFFGAAVWCVGLAVLVIGLIINIMASEFSFLIFGRSSYRSLAFPITLFIAGLALHGVVYGYFREHLQMNRANLLQIVNSGIVPLIMLLWGPRSVGPVLEETGAVILFVSALGYCGHPGGTLLRIAAPKQKSYFVMASPASGDFALIALLGLPTFLVAHLMGVQDAGYVAFGVSVLGMIAAVFKPSV